MRGRGALSRRRGLAGAGYELAMPLVADGCCRAGYGRVGSECVSVEKGCSVTKLTLPDWGHATWPAVWAGVRGPLQAHGRTGQLETNTCLAQLLCEQTPIAARRLVARAAAACQP